MPKPLVAADNGLFYIGSGSISCSQDDYLDGHDVCMVSYINSYYDINLVTASVRVFEWYGFK